MKTQRFLYHLFSVRTLLGIVLLATLLNQPVLAGKLDDFEQEATEQKDEQRPHRHHYDDDDDDCDGFWSCLFHAMLWGIFSDNADDDEPRIRPVPETDNNSLYERRNSDRRDSDGSDWGYNPVILPSFRLDAGYQGVESDVHALDLRAELGGGWTGLQGRLTYYFEDDPTDHLWLNYLHGLARLRLGNHLQIAGGPGVVMLDGFDRNYGFSFTSSFLVYPQDSLGIELRPTWSWIDENELNDCDLGLIWGGTNTALRVGYRWVNTGHQSLDGAYFGVLVRF